MAFKLRSGNGPLKFKNMGSSPMKHPSEDAGGVVHYHNKYGEHEEGYQVEDDPETGKPAGTTTTREASYAPGVHAFGEEGLTMGFSEYLSRLGMNPEAFWKDMGYTYPKTTGEGTEVGIKTIEERGVEERRIFKERKKKKEVSEDE